VALRGVARHGRRLAYVCALACALCAVWSCASASAVEYVDGISDQSVPYWDGGYGGYFTEFFKNDWLPAGHIKYARYVVRWSAINGSENTTYQDWCTDAGTAYWNGLHLTLDLSLTSFNASEARPTPTQYREYLSDLLTQCPAISIVEPWNEPNNAGATYVNPTLAAEYAKEAASVCSEPAHGCSTVVGNLLDSSSMVGYENEYREALKGWVFPYWGMHPYYAVKNESATTVSEFEGHWGDGASSLWFTEVGAYNCLDYGALEVPGEINQREHAEWFVQNLIKDAAHVFYYEVLDKDREQPQTECERTGAPDTALYVPSSDPNAPDRPRPAAAWIYDNKGEPWAYTGGASVVYKKYAYLTGSVYPGGYPTDYYFQFGTSPSSKTNSTEGSAGEGIEDTGADMGVEYLTPYTTYYYRIVALNGYGEDAGVEKTFKTESAPASAATQSASEVTRTTAKFHGEVYPDGVSTDYYFTYNEVGGGPQYTEHVYAGGDEAWHSESPTVTELKSCTKYQVQIMAENVDPPSPVSGGVKEFETECWPPSATTDAVKAVKRTSAELEGEVYPNGLKTEYWFEYSKRGAEFKKTSVLEAGSNDAWHAEHATVTLEPCVEYQFRVVAENEDSHNGPPKGDVYGETKYFETKCKPLIQGVKTSELRPNSVVLNAEVNPQEAETTYHFEYDTREYKEGEAAHGTSVPAQPTSIGSGAAFVKVNDAVVNLIPSQTYYYRAVAKNVSGETLGAGQSFKPPEDWELAGKLVTTSKPATAEGTLVVGNVLARAECRMKEEGEIKAVGAGEITKVTGSKGESVLLCPGAKGSICEGVTAEVEPTGLPWKTELVDEPIKNEKGEVVRDEVRERFYGTSEVSPGWTVKCTNGGKWKAVCTGESSGNVENVSAGVPVEFDAKSPLLKCSGTGGEGGGAVEGALVVAGTEGLLSVFGAASGPLRPAVVTAAATSVTSTGATLNGTVAPKALETRYRFEYGTSTSYGKDIPVSEEPKVGSGRLPVAVSQTLSGLEPSTLYHYRLVATSSAGTSYGEDKTFTPGYPAEWKETFHSAVKAEGTVVLEDSGSDVTAECTVREEGTVTGAKGTITTVTNAKGETKFTCHTIKQGFCGEAAVEVQATSLPWSTELIDAPIKNTKGEVVRYEPRQRFYGSSAPGWQLSCKALGSTVTDTCTGEPSGNVENVTAGVPVEFDSKSLSLACTGSAIGVGAVEGVLLTTITEGTLSVYGAKTGPLAPAVVTREASGVTSSGAGLNGTIGAKGAKTEYHFEYGTSTSYGTSVPVPEGKAGEGRTRVGVSEAVTGLHENTLYHYRLVAKNSAGTSDGEDKTFTTN
jgi:phosphodiesterase/alkaline phosphatase D-like protein